MSNDTESCIEEMLQNAIKLARSSASYTPELFPAYLDYPIIVLPEQEEEDEVSNILTYEEPTEDSLDEDDVETMKEYNVEDSTEVVKTLDIRENEMTTNNFNLNPLILNYFQYATNKAVVEFASIDIQSDGSLEYTYKNYKSALITSTQEIRTLIIEKFTKSSNVGDLLRSITTTSPEYINALSKMPLQDLNAILDELR